MLSFLGAIIPVGIALSSPDPKYVENKAQAGITIRNTFWWSRLVGDAFQVCLALVFILRNDYEQYDNLALPLCLALVFILRNDYVASLVEKLSPPVDDTGLS